MDELFIDGEYWSVCKNDDGSAILSSAAVGTSFFVYDFNMFAGVQL